MHLTSLRPSTDHNQQKDNVSTTLVPHCGPVNSFDFYANLDTTPNTSPNLVEPDAVCGSVSVDVTSASSFFKTLGTYLKTMFKCLYLSYKGWAYDKWKLSALKTNRRWLYISLSILFLVLFIVIIAVIVSAATSSTSGIQQEIADVKQKTEEQAVEEREHVQAELRPPPTQSYVPVPTTYRGDEIPPFSSSRGFSNRTFDYGASSTYASPTSFYQPQTTSGSFGM